MREKTLSKISITGTVLSILILYIVSAQIVLSNTKIGDIDKSLVGKSVNITGEITSISKNEGTIFINIKDETGDIRVVLWEDNVKSINMKDIDIDSLIEGTSINIIGNVQIYRGEIEVIPIRGSLKII